jgi:SAM-dependent methyltransferase
MQLGAGGPPHFPERPPRRLSVSLAYRGYYLLREVLPPRWFLRCLLNGEWLLRRFAWEQTWRSRPASEALAITRPHVAPFIRAHVRPGSTVIDLGGGSGLASRAAAERARRVVYVDRDPHNASLARDVCLNAGSVEFVVGDAFEVLARLGPFDVAMMLHVLGYSGDAAGTLAAVRRHARRVLVETPDFSADPLNELRVREGLPCHSDALYHVEFTPETLKDCLLEAGFSLALLESRNGCLLAVGDSLP